MKLITKLIANALPTLEETRDKSLSEQTVVVKFFNPTGVGTWHITSGDLDTGRLFGLCDLGYPELGYVSLDELEAYRGPLGIGIERDMYWTPRPLSDIM